MIPTDSVSLSTNEQIAQSFTSYRYSAIDPNRYLQRQLNAFVDSLVRRGHLRSRRDAEISRLINSDAYEMHFLLVDGQVIRSFVSGLELLQDGVAQLFQRTGHEIRSRFEHQDIAPIPREIRGDELYGGWGQGYSSCYMPEVEERAEALFKMICGEEAHRVLNRGPLPITGSSGTQYTLHKRAQYCVERDGVGFCAVVPNVPLWDHLLGIKLLVENDEPSFLKTAKTRQRHADFGQEFLAETSRAWDTARIHDDHRDALLHHWNALRTCF